MISPYTDKVPLCPRADPDAVSRSTEPPSRLPAGASGRSRRWRGSPWILWAWEVCSFYPAWPSTGAATAAGRRRGAGPWTPGRRPEWPEPRQGRKCRTAWWWRARWSLWSSGRRSKKMVKVALENLFIRGKKKKSVDLDHLDEFKVGFFLILDSKAFWEWQQTAVLSEWMNSVECRLFFQTEWIFKKSQSGVSVRKKCKSKCRLSGEDATGELCCQTPRVNSVTPQLVKWKKSNH